MTPLRSFICLLAAASLPAISLAQSVNHQSPSEQISVGTLSIIASPAASVAASAEGSDPAAALVSIAGVGSVLVVTGITEAGKDAFDVLLEGSRQAGKASLRVTRGAVEAVGLSVGTTVNVVAQSTGTVLVASGKVLAFLPNAAGEALLHHSRVPGTSPVVQQGAAR
ncbi:hypothetical protein [Cupriavidus metallidurans]|uniref:hypothetical protein n=1 Tax=Cupriavidus metallidurans TaxID=119219 RepID=UPI001648951C|nr:hypothetical protein [Cupriavidus metallidurans]